MSEDGQLPFMNHVGRQTREGKAREGFPASCLIKSPRVVTRTVLGSWLGSASGGSLPRFPDPQCHILLSPRTHAPPLDRTLTTPGQSCPDSLLQDAIVVTGIVVVVRPALLPRQLLVKRQVPQRINGPSPERAGGMMPCEEVRVLPGRRRRYVVSLPRRRRKPTDGADVRVQEIPVVVVAVRRGRRGFAGLHRVAEGVWAGKRLEIPQGDVEVVVESRAHGLLFAIGAGDCYCCCWCCWMWLISSPLLRRWDDNVSDPAAKGPKTDPAV